MKRLSVMLLTAVAVAALSGMVFAAEPGSSTTQPASAKKATSAPKTTTGEVASFTPGKSLEIKDEAGKVHHYSLSKKTKIEGEVKVGEKVSVTASGRWAQEVKVQTAMVTPPPPAPQAAPAAPK